MSEKAKLEELPEAEESVEEAPREPEAKPKEAPKEEAREEKPKEELREEPRTEEEELGMKKFRFDTRVTPIIEVTMPTSKTSKEFAKVILGDLPFKIVGIEPSAEERLRTEFAAEKADLEKKIAELERRIAGPAQDQTKPLGQSPQQMNAPRATAPASAARQPVTQTQVIETFAKDENACAEATLLMLKGMKTGDVIK